MLRKLGSDSIDGIVRLFVLPTGEGNKTAMEGSVRAYMADLTHDADWNDRQKCKILTLEHHMAAKRMGFETIYEALSTVDAFRTGLLDGSLPVTRLFTSNILPLVAALQNDDKFATARIVRESSPLLSAETLKSATDQRNQLRNAKIAAEGLLKLWRQGAPTCGEVLNYVAEQHLFDLPEALKPFAIRRLNDGPQSNPDDESRDPLDQADAAIERFLLASFSEIAPYAQYISNTAEFGTHQGVKGLEFDRVMVLMDDTEARGFMFGYEKFFGAKELSASDLSNESEGRDNSVSRTRRLFYVTCSRAKKSLALVLYTSAPEAVKMHMLRSEWFDEHEVLLTVPDHPVPA